MATQDIHVTTQGNEWAVKTEGSERASSVHTTQAAAIQAGRAQAKRNESELLVHGRNGRIRLRSTYGKDPVRSKG